MRKESEEKGAEGEREMGQEKTTDEKPSGLEDAGSEFKAQGEKEKRAHEAQEEERRAQEAREEERRAQEEREK